MDNSWTITRKIQSLIKSSLQVNSAIKLNHDHALKTITDKRTTVFLWSNQVNRVGKVTGLNVVH